MDDKLVDTPGKQAVRCRLQFDFGRKLSSTRVVPGPYFLLIILDFQL
jgi:hypothetical protein